MLFFFFLGKNNNKPLFPVSGVYQTSISIFQKVLSTLVHKLQPAISHLNIVSQQMDQKIGLKQET